MSLLLLVLIALWAVSQLWDLYQPAFGHSLVILKTLISLFRCVWLELEPLKTPDVFRFVPIFYDQLISSYPVPGIHIQYLNLHYTL